MMNWKALLAIGAIGFLLPGCASIVRGSGENILITTPPTTGAQCNLTNRRGSWSVVSPGQVRVSKSKEDVTITCTKDGFQDAIASIPSGFEGWTIGNIVIGGVICLGVDAATGAINDYPNAFQVPMTPIPGMTVAQLSGPAPAAPAVVRTAASRPPSLGIIGGTVTRNESGPSNYLDDPYGAWVDGVAPRSLAAEAGIRQGDIIRTYNGHRVSTFDELDAYVLETIPGTTVKLGIFRNRQMIEIELDL